MGHMCRPRERSQARRSRTDILAKRKFRVGCNHYDLLNITHDFSSFDAPSDLFVLLSWSCGLYFRVSLHLFLLPPLGLYLSKLVKSLVHNSILYIYIKCILLSLSPLFSQLPLLSMLSIPWSRLAPVE
jgi:hypothetical protein